MTRMLLLIKRRGVSRAAANERDPTMGRTDRTDRSRMMISGGVRDDGDDADAKKTLFEEFLVDVLFFATFATWGLTSSSATVAWIPTCAHVVFSTAACVATLVARRVVVDETDEKRNVGVAIVAGFACALVGCLDALVVTQVACRLTLNESNKNNPTTLSWGVDVERDVDVVLVVAAHLLGLTTSAYRARRAGHELDVDASFVSLGAGFGVSLAYVVWIVFDASFSRWAVHLLVFVLVFFVVLGPIVDLVVTFGAPCRPERRRALCNLAHVFHAVGVVAQYVVVLANVAYLFDVRTRFWGLAVPYASTCARAQGVGLLLAFACANAHRNANMLATSSGSARRVEEGTASWRGGGRTLARLGEIDPWIGFVATLNDATSSVGPTIVAVTIAFAENASGVARFAVLGYATFAWTRGRAQIACSGWGWEIALAIVGGFLVDVGVGIVLLFFPGLVRADDLETTESRIVAGVAFWDALVAVVVAGAASWARTRDRSKIKNT